MRPGGVILPGEMSRDRSQALSAAHMVPLERYRAELEARHGPTPHCDPLDGGADAECLLLLETPGPRGDTVRFVSRDNATGTARNITRFCAAAGLDRRRMVIWNAVPWTIHAPGARNRAPRRAEIAMGLAELPGFLALLPALRVVVLSGRVAAEAAPVIEAARPDLPVLTMAHPSPTYVVTAPDIAGRLVATLAEAAAILKRGTQSPTRVEASRFSPPSS